MEGGEKESGKGRNEEPILGCQTKSKKEKRKGRKMKMKIMDKSKGGWMEGRKERREAAVNNISKTKKKSNVKSGIPIGHTLSTF